MRSEFPLFQSHLDLARQYREKILLPGDIAVDATCGNGKDTLTLARLALTNNSGTLYAYDIQPDAIAAAQEYVHRHTSPEVFARIRFLLSDHTEFSSDIIPGSVKLLVYNLGYLPGGDKNITTKATSTIASLLSAVPLIAPHGAISITCYPGHPEGLVEEAQITQWASTLDPTEWSSCRHQWLNRRAAPSLLLLQRSSKPHNLFITRK